MLYYDEALYWVWAQRLDWSYVDQPPLIAYLVALTTLLVIVSSAAGPWTPGQLVSAMLVIPVTTLGGWLNAGLLYAVLVRRGQFVADARLTRALPRIVLASLAMGAALWFAAVALAPWFGPAHGILARMLALAALVGAGLAVYAAVVLVLGVLDLRQLRGFLGRRPAGPA